ncbi:uncharacterized protein LOC135372783 [Ornithodoros turicata]|uniref:uncharacterized protein LOC135372783 n=1 Tax=Ornithodoros turicata TaxID=34597 RepID=UPI003139D418
MATWVASFRVPDEVITYRGPHFESHLFRAFTKFLGTARLRTTAYHPACNGLVERFHRHLKQALMTHGDRNRWNEFLPFALLGIRAALKPDLGYSSAEIVFGAALRLPADLFSPTEPSSTTPTEYARHLQRLFADLRATPTRAVSTSSYVSPDLSSATHIFLRTDSIRRSLQPPFSGSHPVLKRGDKTFTINLNGRPEVVSIDRIKLTFVEPSSPISCTLHDVAAPPSAAPAASKTVTSADRSQAPPLGPRRPFLPLPIRHLPPILKHPR